MRKLTKAAAARMWDELRDGFTNVETQIVQIIEQRAWEPLGYASFAEAWAERLAGVRLATDECRAHVVYAMLADGLGDAEIVTGVGIGDAAVANLRRQRALGVPARHARVRQHVRSLPRAPFIVKVELDHETLAEYQAAASALGLLFADEAAEAVRLKGLELVVQADRMRSQAG